MDTPAWIALGAIFQALISNATIVLVLYIRAKYKWSNGSEHEKPEKESK